MGASVRRDLCPLAVGVVAWCYCTRILIGPGLAASAVLAAGCAFSCTHSRIQHICTQNSNSSTGSPCRLHNCLRQTLEPTSLTLVLRHEHFRQLMYNRQESNFATKMCSCTIELIKRSRISASPTAAHRSITLSSADGVWSKPRLLSSALHISTFTAL